MAQISRICTGRSAMNAPCGSLAPWTVPPRRVTDYPTCHTDDLKEDVLRCQALVEQRGLELLVLDMTRPDICIPVVRVMAPGLRPFWARFAPGRLYDVPVKLGLRDRPLLENELTPFLPHS